MTDGHSPWTRSAAQVRMLTQLSEEWLPGLIGAALVGLLIWWSLPRRRHLGAALLEVLAITVAAGLRPTVLRAFPGISDHAHKVLLSAVVAGLVIAPLYYLASIVRERATIHGSPTNRSSEQPGRGDSTTVAIVILLLGILAVPVVRSAVTQIRNVRRPRTTFMYGIPKDLRLERLVGQEFNFIGLGRFQIQFHISSLVAIQVEGRWELRDASGVLVDSQQEHGARATDCLHCIIDVPITRFTIDAPRSLTLFF